MALFHQTSTNSALRASVDEIERLLWFGLGAPGRIWARSSATSARTEAALAARRRHLLVDNTVLRDCGLTREDLVGPTDWQDDLPFFLRPGFGSRDRQD